MDFDHHYWCAGDVVGVEAMSALIYYREIVIGILVIVIGVLGMVVMGKNVTIAEMEGELYQTKSALEYQSSELMQQDAKHKAALEALPREIVKIETKYKVIYDDIETWKGDENASDCKNAMDFLTGFNY